MKTPFTRLVLPALFATLLSNTACAQNQPTAVSPQQAKEMLARPNVVLLDVRTPTEFEAGHVRGARNLNFLSTEFPAQVAKLDPNATYVLYCASGNRSGKATTLMQQNGFKNVVNAGGFSTLKENGLPTE